MNSLLSAGVRMFLWHNQQQQCRQAESEAAAMASLHSHQAMQLQIRMSNWCTVGPWNSVQG